VSHGQQGLLSPRKDPQALAKSLSLLIENPELAQRMGARGRQIVEKYRWSVVASQVEDYYEDCLRSVNGFARKRAV
jgi:D-inositol-3-phosphate glycosyltransferase